MDKKQSVPKTKIKKLRPVTFDMSKMVANYVLAGFVMQIMEERLDVPNREYNMGFLLGVQRAYKDWFAALRLSEDKLAGIIRKLDKREIMLKAREFVMNLITKNERRIILPGEDVKAMKAAKEIMDKQFRLR